MELIKELFSMWKKINFMDNKRYPKHVASVQKRKQMGCLCILNIFPCISHKEMNLHEFFEAFLSSWLLSICLSTIYLMKVLNLHLHVVSTQEWGKTKQNTPLNSKIVSDQGLFLSPVFGLKILKQLSPDLCVNVGQVPESEQRSSEVKKYRPNFLSASLCFHTMDPSFL